MGGRPDEFAPGPAGPGAIRPGLDGFVPAEASDYAGLREIIDTVERVDRVHDQGTHP